jgi:hypothetical protein
MQLSLSWEPNSPSASHEIVCFNRTQRFTGVHKNLPPSVCSSFNVRDQGSHQYKTAGKVIVCMFLIFMLLDGK